MFGWAPFDDVITWLTHSLERPYLLGDRFSAADIVIGGSLPLLMGRGIVPESDVFKSYVQRITARPAYGRSQTKDSG
jgi:glutathione S-transferase